MGFFLREAKRSYKLSSTLLISPDELPDEDIIREIGGKYKYYCFVVADFDPIKANEIYNNATLEDITHAMLARSYFNKPPEDAKN